MYLEPMEYFLRHRWGLVLAIAVLGVLAGLGVNALAAADPVFVRLHERCRLIGYPLVYRVFTLVFAPGAFTAYRLCKRGQKKRKRDFFFENRTFPRALGLPMRYAVDLLYRALKKGRRRCAVINGEACEEALWEEDFLTKRQAFQMTAAITAVALALFLSIGAYFRPSTPFSLFYLFLVTVGGSFCSYCFSAYGMDTSRRARFWDEVCRLAEECVALEEHGDEDGFFFAQGRLNQTLRRLLCQRGECWAEQDFCLLLRDG